MEWKCQVFFLAIAQNVTQLLISTSIFLGKICHCGSRLIKGIYLDSLTNIVLIKTCDRLWDANVISYPKIL
jgi:hypothetical protein